MFISFRHTAINYFLIHCPVGTSSTILFPSREIGVSFLEINIEEPAGREPNKLIRIRIDNRLCVSGVHCPHRPHILIIMLIIIHNVTLHFTSLVFMSSLSIEIRQKQLILSVVD